MRASGGSRPSRRTRVARISGDAGAGRPCAPTTPWCCRSARERSARGRAPLAARRPRRPLRQLQIDPRKHGSVASHRMSARVTTRSMSRSGRTQSRRKCVSGGARRPASASLLLIMNIIPSASVARRAHVGVYVLALADARRAAVHRSPPRRAARRVARRALVGSLLPTDHRAVEPLLDLPGRRAPPRRVRPRRGDMPAQARSSVYASRSSPRSERWRLRSRR